MTTAHTANFTDDGDDVVMVDSYHLLESIINTKDPTLKKYDTDWHSVEQGQRSLKRLK